MKQCKFCKTDFEPRRKNHVYCTTSCKTMASYKRNKYKYVPGHYQKERGINQQLVPITNLPKEDVSKEQLIDVASNSPKNPKSNIAHAAAGNLLADASVYGLKKLLSPDSLNATKGDLKTLKKDIEELKIQIQQLVNNRY